ncbi:MAG: PHP domain-containing protein, partial [Oscillospiraceae bacterium]|nr:PHP domain-containing protein [Oscillospiraceae bacterium]
MEETVALLAMFSRFEPEQPLREALTDAEVLHAEINCAQRQVTVEIACKRYLPTALLTQFAGGAARAYGVGRVHLVERCPRDFLIGDAFLDVADAIISDYSMAVGTLAGAKWSLTGDQITISLRANGAHALEQHLRAGENFVLERFGFRPSFSVIAGNQVEGAALYAETERLRNEALRNVSLPEYKAAPEKKRELADVIYGRAVRGEPVPIKEVNLDMSTVVVQGLVFAINHKELKKRGAWVVNFDITDYTGSIRISQFMEEAQAKPILDRVQTGMWLKIQGRMDVDRYEHENVLHPNAIEVGKRTLREDRGEDKRVELHLHTNMSAMDALTDPGEAVKTAARWGHKAIAITDHGVLQSFPDAMKAASKAKVAGTDENIKVLYGCEAYYVNDLDDRIVVHGEQNSSLDDEFVAFDLETTGLKAATEEITEIGAAVFRGGEVVDKFNVLVNPGKPIPFRITELTGITDAMVKDQPPIAVALPQFLAFVGNRPLCAHNAEFDIGFIMAACRRLGTDYDPTYVDSLIMAQNLLPELNKHKLDVVAEAMDLPEFNHHRAVDDAMTVVYMLQKFFDQLKQQGVTELREINPLMMKKRAGGRIDNRHARHLIVFAKNNTGLRNLYRLVSYAHLKYYHRKPRMPKSELCRWREGLLIGSACEAGELFQAVIEGKSHTELKR